MNERRRRSPPHAPRPADVGASPHVLLDVEYRQGLLYLVLANDGSAPARNVRVRFARALRGVGGERDIAALQIWKGLPLLRANKEVRVFLDAAPLLFRRRQPTRFAATVSYADREGREVSEVFRHDLGVWRDFGEILGAEESLRVRT